MSWADGLPLAGADPTTAAAKVYALAQPIIEETGVSMQSILGDSHESRIVLARHTLYVAMWRRGFSLVEIGRICGRNHATVRAGIRRLLGPDEYRLTKAHRALVLVRRLA